MSFEKERAEAIALVEEALEDFDIDATRAEINSFVDAYTADTINNLELVDIAEAYRNFTSDEQPIYCAFDKKIRNSSFKLNMV